jgi:hypothetical protein
MTNLSSIATARVPTLLSTLLPYRSEFLCLRHVLSTREYCDDIGMRAPPLYTQFASFNPSTWLKCFSLFVTSVTPSAVACAAISPS